MPKKTEFDIYKPSGVASYRKLMLSRQRKYLQNRSPVDAMFVLFCQIEEFQRLYPHHVSLTPFTMSDDASSIWSQYQTLRGDAARFM